MVKLNWKPRRYFKEEKLRYCSPACGAHCTKVDFDFATEQAHRLAVKIGKGWKVRVWENLGWHYQIYKGVCDIHPQKLYRQNYKGKSARWKVIGYTAYFNSKPQIIGEGKTALEALGRVLNKVNKTIEILHRDFDKVYRRAD